MLIQNLSSIPYFSRQQKPKSCENHKSTLSFGMDVVDLHKSKDDVQRYTSSMFIKESDLYFYNTIIEGRGYNGQKRAFNNAVFVDVGSNNGALSRTLRGKYNNLKTINIDINEKINDAAKKLDILSGLTKNVQYKTGNAYSLPIKDKSADIITFNRIMHEIYSYESREYNQEKFSKNSVTKALKEATQKLKDDGIILVRDCFRTYHYENPDKNCIIKVRKENTSLTKAEILNSDVTKLDTYNLLKRFCLEFEPAKNNYKFDENSCTMPVWLAEEFIRHRKFNDTQKHWDDEINEQYCALSCYDYSEIAKEAGLKRCYEGIVSRGAESNFYDFDENELIIEDEETGERINYFLNMSSHIELIFKKG